MLPTRRPKKIDAVEDGIEVEDVVDDDVVDAETGGNMDRVVSITQTAEIEYDDDDAESYVV